ncbi:integrase, catalytic region, zinc finger, CCHC-type containing protein [Tanacetum coccineum]
MDTPTAITEGSWGFEHTKACFRDEIIPFVKALRDLSSTFNQHLVDELSEVQNVFYQMEQAVKQHRIELKIFEVKMNQALNENERLLDQVMSKDIVNLLVNPSVENDSVNVHDCQKCLKLEIELQTNFVKRETYDKLFKSFTILEKHCISLEVDTQLKHEIFQRENSISNQSVPSFDQLFELNELKAQSQEKDMLIKELKERIKSLSGNMDKDKIKQDLEDIETINIELDHRVTKLIVENEHLKQTYKQLYDSIKPARIQSKEQCAKLISQVNLKSVEISDLRPKSSENKLCDPELYQLNVEPITLKLLNKRTANSAYIKHSQEEVAVLRDLVDHIKANYTLRYHILEYACRARRNPTHKPKIWDNYQEKLLSVAYGSVMDQWTQLAGFNSFEGIAAALQPCLAFISCKAQVKAARSKGLFSCRSSEEKWSSDALGSWITSMDGYGEIGNVTISRVYYVEGLGHNLFSVGQFYDSNLEVAFRQHTCYIRNLQGIDLLTGSRGDNLYTLSLGDMMASSPICLLSKASKTKSWLWHRRLSHLNFGAINHLARYGLVRDNGTEFVNQTLREYYEKVGISHETSVARSPQQNGVVERRNRTLIEAARTMLIYAKAPLFLWAEAVATACYTQNRSMIRRRHGKTPYELLHNKPPDLSYLHVFGALCYPTNDSENLGKLQPKADIGIFIGYAPTKKAFRIYNRRTRRIQKRANTDTRTEECTRARNSKPKPEKVNLGQTSVNKSQKQKDKNSKVSI